MNRVLPREVAQAVKGSIDTRFYGVGSSDVGKELPRNKSVLCVSFVGGLSHEAPTGNVSRMNVRSGGTRYFQHAHFIPIVGVGKRGEY